MPAARSARSTGPAAASRVRTSNSTVTSRTPSAASACASSLAASACRNILRGTLARRSASVRATSGPSASNNSMPAWYTLPATMIAWELIDRAQVPGSAQRLELHRRGQEWSIRVGGQELMNSRQHGSEEILAELACAAISDQAEPRVLIGGLGMGFSLAAALRKLGSRAQLTVAELVPAVISWNRGELAQLAGHPLADERVRIEQGDVGALIAAARACY